MRRPVWTLMIVRFNPSALRQTHFYEYLVRFGLGGAMTLIAGLIAARFGPLVGGLFLPFPAFFPASATLFQKHVREPTEKVGLPGTWRGKVTAAVVAVGAAISSYGHVSLCMAMWQ